MIEHPSQTTQTCAALPVSSDRMFLFTSAANQGRDGTWTGGDLPGVRDGAAAQCCFHAYRHHVPQQSSKLMLHRQAVCTLQYACHVYISCLLQGALPLSSHCVAIHSSSVQRLNACIAFGKHISPNVMRTPAVHFAPVQCHAVATEHHASSLLALQYLDWNSSFPFLQSCDWYCVPT